VQEIFLGLLIFSNTAGPFFPVERLKNEAQSCRLHRLASFASPHVSIWRIVLQVTSSQLQ